MRRALLGWTLSGVVIGALPACSSIQPYILERIDYSKTQQPALILVGDPKVYSRETLINDRRAEEEFLQELLKETMIDAAEIKKATPDFRSRFEPQLLSEIRSIEALTTALGVSFDPSQGAAAQRDNRLASLQAELAAKQIETDIARQEKVLEAVRAAKPPEANLTERSSTSTGNSGKPETKAVEFDTRLANMQNRLDAQRMTLEKLQADSLPNVRKTEAKPNPRDLLQDIQAYRSELRSALNATRLDDRHADLGKALLRLQFDASIFPGNQSSRQWGAARLTVVEPKIDKYKLEQLYFSWLGYAAARLNMRGRTGTYIDNDLYYGVTFDATYYSLLVATGLYDVTPIYFSKNHQIGHNPRDACLMGARKLNECYALYLPVPKGLGGDIQNAVQGAGARASKPARRALNIALQGVAHGIKVNELPIKRGAKAFIVDLIRLLEMEDGFADPDAGRCVPGNYHSDCFEVNARFCQDGRIWDDDHASYLFACILTGNVSHVGHKPDVSVYEVGPIELAERRSTVASAAHSFEAAVALAAALPNAGVGIDAGLGYMQAVSGKVDALERLPLVIGFANEGGVMATEGEIPPTANPHDEFNPARFGWLFGPRMQVNEREKKLELIHRPANYKVSADLSVPGWWPHIDLGVQTAWIGNWNPGAGMFRECDAGEAAVCSTNYRRIRVPIPASMETFNGLTEFVLRARGRILPNQPTIVRVYPSTLSACAKDIRFVIEGSNLWRTPQVYLGGVELDEPRVLPNMRGLSASANIDKFFALSAGQDRKESDSTDLELTVATRDGVASAGIRILGARENATHCLSSAAGASATSDLRPTPIVKQDDPPQRGRAQQRPPATQTDRSDGLLGPARPERVAPPA